MFRSINPHDPSDTVGEFEAAGPEDVNRAVSRAREAFSEWRTQPASVRGGVFAGIADNTETRTILISP